MVPEPSVVVVSPRLLPAEVKTEVASVRHLICTLSPNARGVDNLYSYCLKLVLLKYVPTGIKSVSITVCPPVYGIVPDVSIPYVEIPDTQALKYCTPIAF